VKKHLFFICGILSVILGTLGIFIPLLPTTPFLLLAAWCFLRSSKKAHDWLLNNKLYGKYIKAYIEKTGIPIKIKIFTLILLWSGIGYAFFFATNNSVVRILLIVIVISVSTHIILIQNKSKQ